MEEKRELSLEEIKLEKQILFLKNSEKMLLNTLYETIDKNNGVSNSSDQIVEEIIKIQNEMENILKKISDNKLENNNKVENCSMDEVIEYKRQPLELLYRHRLCVSCGGLGKG